MPKVPFWIFIVIAILYFTAVGVDTMDIDASQYAEMSREMLQHGNYLQLYDRGIDYLDKPPFLFWISSFSMKLFGANNLGYKLPSILFALWAIFATYKLAKLLYNDAVGRMSALVLACCQGMFLMTNDVRCDTILMSWVITAIWLIKEWSLNNRLLYLLGGCGAIAFGMMTKGPLALMVPVFCFLSDWILKREWRNFFRPAYLLGLIFIALLLIPMSIGLYQQFDLHPEKLVANKTGVSGLRFFYWSQSFGRITGESPWKNGADISFLLLNMLWSFLPWIFLFITAIVVNSIQLVRQRFRLTPQQEWLTTGGFLLTYLSLGVSAYQLPHYIFVAFPLAAIVVGKFMYALIEEEQYRRLYIFFKPFQAVISCLLLLVTLLLLVWVFPAPVFLIVTWVAAFILWGYLAVRKMLKGKLFWLSASAIIMVNLFLSNHVYPELLKYQGGSQLGRFIHSLSVPEKEICFYKIEDPMNSLHFYAGEQIQGFDSLVDVRTRKYVVTMGTGLNSIKQKGYSFDILKAGDMFKVSELTPEFLDPKTRNTATRKYYLLKFK